MWIILTLGFSILVSPNGPLSVKYTQSIKIFKNIIFFLIK